MSQSNKFNQDVFHSITPYLTVQGADAAIAFYKKIFSAKEVGRLTMMGKVGHAELSIGNATLYLSDEFLEWGNKSPQTLGGSPVTIALRVEDVDAVFKAATDAGATALEVVKDAFYGERMGVFADPFGHRWHVSTHIEDVSFAEMQRRCDAMAAAK